MGGDFLGNCFYWHEHFGWLSPTEERAFLETILFVIKMTSCDWDFWIMVTAQETLFISEVSSNCGASISSACVSCQCRKIVENLCRDPESCHA